MSYTMVGLGAFGAVKQVPCGGARVDLCNGPQTVCDGDYCCPTNTWSNATYKAIKGSTSLRRYNEKRVRSAFGYLTTPTPSGSTALEEYAYDNSLVVPAGLMNRIRVASANFDLLFPASRYRKKGDCRKTDCTDSGYYSCYREDPPAATSQRLALIKQLSGGSVTAQRYLSIDYTNVHKSGQCMTPTGCGTRSWGEPYGERWPSVPAHYKLWVIKALAAIDGTLYSGGGENIEKNVDAAAEHPKNFFDIRGGTIVPKPWLQALLDAFLPMQRLQTWAPSGRRMTFTRPSVTAGKGTAQHVTVEIAPVEGGEPEPPPAPPELEPGGIDPKILAIGGVALVGVAFGAYVLLKK